MEPQASARSQSDSGGGQPKEISAFEIDEDEEEDDLRHVMPFEKVKSDESQGIDKAEKQAWDQES